MTHATDHYRPAINSHSSAICVRKGGRTTWIVDAHGYGKRFIVRSDEMLTGFVELQRAIHEFAVSLIA